MIFVNELDLYIVSKWKLTSSLLIKVSLLTSSKFVRFIFVKLTCSWLSLMYRRCFSKNRPLQNINKITKQRNQQNSTFSTHLETPTFPNVRVLDISGRMQARFFRCCGCLIQSSQKLNIVCFIYLTFYIADHTTYARGHLTDNSDHKSLVSIQPRPGKKSVRYNRLG